MNRLATDWVYGGGLAGGLLLLLTPLIAADATRAETAVYLLLPVYMLHQYEEHAGDRFRRMVNGLLGFEALTPLAVFIINIAGVWGLIGAALLGQRFVAPGWGLAAVYLVLVNAFVHIAQAARLRAYNPGLATAVLLFLPAGGYALRAVSAESGASAGAHIAGLGVALAAHAGILAYVFARRPSV